MKSATKAIRIRARARGERWKPRFLKCLRRTGNASASAEYAAIHPGTAHRHRQRDPKFAAQWKEALAEAIDKMELVARSRAMNGVDEPVYMRDRDGKPILVGHVKKYSDYLLGLLLKAYLPEKYGRDRKVQIALNGPPKSKAKKEFDYQGFAALVKKTFGEAQAVERGDCVTEQPQPVTPSAEKLVAAPVLNSEPQKSTARPHPDSQPNPQPDPPFGTVEYYRKLGVTVCGSDEQLNARSHRAAGYCGSI